MLLRLPICTLVAGACAFTLMAKILKPSSVTLRRPAQELLVIYGESYWDHNSKHVLRTQLERAKLEAAAALEAKDNEIAELRRLLATRSRA